MADELSQRRAAVMAGGGEERIRAQHAKGKLTARERLDLLLDRGSFVETDPHMLHRHFGFGLERERYPGDGVVTGFGTLDGRQVAVYAQDFTILGGSYSEVQALKVTRLIDLALGAGVPVIALNDSVGARIQEGVWGLTGYGELFWRNTQASGVIPQISVMLGPCAGGAVYSPGLTDFVIMTRRISHMFITGPEVIQAVTGETIDLESLGGAEIHSTRSGVAHFVAEDEREAFALTRRLLSYLPSNNAEDPPFRSAGDDPRRMDEALDSLIPASPTAAYDVREAIARIFDPDSFLEVHAAFAPNAVVGFARLAGRGVAVIANQPAHLAGVIDMDASDKIARFVRFADAFNFPIITFVDSPGFLPGSAQEHGGIIRHGAKIVFAYSEATSPKISIVLRKSYGGAHIVMGSKATRSDLCFAWPTAEIAVMGAEGAVRVLYGRELAGKADAESKMKRLEMEYRQRFGSPFAAAEGGHIDDVIYPRETRARLVASLEFLKDKQASALPKKHGNIPL